MVMRALFSTLALLCVFLAHSQEEQPAVIETEPVAAFSAYKNFYAPGQGSYIETYLSVVGHTINYVTNDKGNLQGQIQVTQIIKKGDSIVDFKKYNLKSPIIGQDSIINDFVDQKRWVLKPGMYTYELEIIDLNNSSRKPTTASQIIEVRGVDKSTVSTSDIELLQSFQKSDVYTEWSKSGYEVVPYVTNYYPPYTGKIAYYMELYGTEKALGIDGRFIVNQFIEKASSQTKFQDYFRFTKLSTEPVNVVFNSFTIEDLPTGSYNLVIEVRDKTNKLVCKQKQYFERLNPSATPDMSSLEDVDYTGSFADNFETEDSITEAIRCLSPIASDLENAVIQNQLESIDMETKKQFFYNFWNRRYDDEAEMKWEEYLVQVKQVDKLFGTKVKKGYVTDRGRVYLKYGAPNTMTDRPNEPSSYPYQIWHYYKLGNFSNRRFIFYLPDLVTNDYEILHSDMRGERQNYRWQMDLQKRTTPFDNWDQTTPLNGSHGTRSEELFTNPR